MLNTTNTSANSLLLQSLQTWDEAILLITVGIPLCVLLYYAAQIESEPITKDFLRRRQQQLKMAAKLEAASQQTDRPLTPHPHQAFRRLNPIQSAERRQRKRSESAAAAQIAENAAATPRLCQNCGCLNPDQSLERHRGVPSNMMKDVPHAAVLATDENYNRGDLQC